jgi:hypothetical protein
VWVWEGCISGFWTQSKTKEKKERYMPLQSCANESKK